MSAYPGDKHSGYDFCSMYGGLPLVLSKTSDDAKMKYLTGSNAFLLSSDIAMLFTGRCLEIAVYPFSYSEYLRYFGSEEVMKGFDKYYVDGGMSGSYLYPNEELKLDYVKDIQT